MVAQILEHYYSGEFLLREANGSYSRDVVVFDNTAGTLDLLVPGGTVFSFEAPGTVVNATAGNTGNGTITNVQTNLIAAELGAYVITFSGATTFGVQAPDGTIMNPGVVGTAYLDGISFLVTAGGTPFQAGDSGTITLADGVAPAYAATAGNHGNGTVTQIGGTQDATAQQGNYSVIFTAATKFNVIAPDGRQLATGSTGAYYADEIGFLATVGGTGFVAGDSFTVGVNAGTGMVQAYTGSAPAAGIIYNTDYVPAGGTLKMTAIMRDAEVIGSALQWIGNPPPGSQQTAIQQLRALQGGGIITR